MGDAFVTPLVFIGRLDDPLSELIQYSVHNDSIKLVPSLIEGLVKLLGGHWSIEASLWLGFASLIFLVYLFLRLLWPPLDDKYSQVVKVLTISLLIIPTSAWIFRFSTAFAIHRTIPVITAVIASSILFKRRADTRPSVVDSIRLSILSLISIYTFAIGYILPEMISGVIAFKCLKLRAGFKPLVVYSLATFPGAFYALILIKSYHERSWTSGTLKPAMYISNSLAFSVRFITYSWEPTVFIAFALLAAYLLFRKILRSDGSKILQKSFQKSIAGKSQIHYTKRLIFVSFFACTTIPLWVAARIERVAINGSYWAGINVPDRYFLEASVASICIVIIINQLGFPKKILCALVCLNFLLLYPKSLLYSYKHIEKIKVSPNAGMAAIRCTKDSELPSSIDFYERCLKSRVEGLTENGIRLGNGATISNSEYSQIFENIFKGPE